MKEKILIWMLIFYNISPSSAQVVKSIFQVNFLTDEYALDEQDKKILDGIIQEIKAQKYCELGIFAHTDNEASNTYNLILSQKRANSVLQYLKEKSKKDIIINVAALGEAKPKMENNTEDGKFLNRRVEIELSKYSLASPADILSVVGGNYTQVFSLGLGNISSIIGKNGTKISVPKNTFVTQDGRTIANEDVKLELQEFLNPEDAVFNRLSTVADGKLLESGGMFNITAKYNGSVLKIKDGGQIKVQIPSSSLKKGMQVFTGVKKQNGVTEWKATNKTFLENANIKKPYINFNENSLKTYLQTVMETLKMDTMSTFRMIKPAQKAQIPQKPNASKKIDKQKMFTFFQRLFYTQQKKDRLYNAEVLKRENRLGKKMARFDISYNQYLNDSINFNYDSALYAANSNAFYIWLDKLLETNNKQILNLEKIAFNKGLNTLLDKSKKNELKTGGFASYLTNSISNNPELESQIKELKFRNFVLSMLSNSNMIEVKIHNHIFHLDSCYISSYYKELWERSFYYATYTKNQFADNLIRSSSAFKNILDAAEDELMVKHESLGLLSSREMGNFYTATVSNMGYINCDKFVNTPPNQMAKVNIKTGANAIVTCYLPSYNSCISADGTAGNYSLNLPVGSKVTVVVVELIEGVPMFKKQTYNVQPNLSLALSTQKTSLLTIKKELSLLKRS